MRAEESLPTKLSACSGTKASDPAHELVQRLSRLGEAARDGAPVTVVRGTADRHARHDGDVVRNGKQLLERRLMLDGDAEDPGRVALVDRGQEDEHHRGAR